MGADVIKVSEFQMVTTPPFLATRHRGRVGRLHDDEPQQARRCYRFEELEGKEVLIR